MNILLVDDSETNRKLLRVNLQAQGHTTVEAMDGMEALEALGRAPMDAIVSDVLMPRMDGYRLCYEVRRHEQYRHLHFIVYSSTYTSPADEKLARDFGADEFVKKPGGIKEILALLKNRTQGLAAAGSVSPGLIGELAVMREYSQVLVRKLEQNNAELETTREKLLRTNEALLLRTRELEQSKKELSGANDALELRVGQRTAELEAANKDLESFSYSVSHDLRAPLRAVDGFTRILTEQSGALLDETGRRLLQQIQAAAKRMGLLIDALLALGRLTRANLGRRRVDLSALAADIVQTLRQDDTERNVEVIIAPNLVAEGDPALLRLVLENLLGNAWKYTARQAAARIEFGTVAAAAPPKPAGEGGTRTADVDQSLRTPVIPVFFVRDNGAGFDMAYAGKLFEVFQRLHSNDDFPGIGIGLATVRRIIERHGGSVRAEAALKRGATFYFTLGTADTHERPDR
jgi:signal transduction histidine kinase